VILLGNLRAQLGQGQVIAFRQQLAHPVAHWRTQRGGFPPTPGLGIGGTRFALPADEVADRGRAYTKQGCHFMLGVVVVFVSRDEGAAQIIGVGFHKPDVIPALR
jgi:hypothetical protein